MANLSPITLIKLLLFLTLLMAFYYKHAYFFALMPNFFLFCFGCIDCSLYQRVYLIEVKVKLTSTCFSL